MDIYSIYSQMFGLSLSSLQLGFLVCIFVVLIFKPERIARPGLFKIACALFVITLLAPILQVVLASATSTPGVGRTSSAASGLSGVLMAFINPVIFSAAFMAAVGSLMQKPASHSPG